MAHDTGTNELEGVDVAGPADAQSIVFVHGAMFTRKMWAPQRDALADEFRVVSPDLPGHGARADRDFDLEPALALLDEVVEREAGGRAVLVGLSLGGYVVTEYASRHPTKTDGLVVVGASANPVRGMNLLTRATGALVRLATRSDRIEREVRERGEQWVLERDLSPETEREIIESGIYPRQFGTPGPDLAGRDFRAGLAAYPGPVLIVNGEHDEVMRRGEEEHAAVANGDVVVIEGVGHICNLHRPEAFTDVVRDFARRVETEATPSEGA